MCLHWMWYTQVSWHGPESNTFPRRPSKFGISALSPVNNGKKQVVLYQICLFSGPSTQLHAITQTPTILWKSRRKKVFWRMLLRSSKPSALKSFGTCCTCRSSNLSVLVVPVKKLTTCNHTNTNHPLKSRRKNVFWRMLLRSSNPSALKSFGTCCTCRSSNLSVLVVPVKKLTTCNHTNTNHPLKSRRKKVFWRMLLRSSNPSVLVVPVVAQIFRYLLYLSKSWLHAITQTPTILWKAGAKRFSDACCCVAGFFGTCCTCQKVSSNPSVLVVPVKKLSNISIGWDIKIKISLDNSWSCPALDDLIGIFEHGICNVLWIMHGLTVGWRCKYWDHE